MKILQVLLLLPYIAFGQYPQVEEFNPGTTWTFTNGSGIQNYGPPENYATTNVGTTPYPNSATVLITSPITSYATCASALTVSFPLQGRIENGWDFLYFQYSVNGGATWVNVATYTGIQNTTYTYTIPNTANRFRFRLVTDATVNTYGFPFVNVYYYDIARFTVNCLTPLPLEITTFTVDTSCFANVLSWVGEGAEKVTYTLERSVDGETWNQFKTVVGKGVGTYFLTDSGFERSQINYYRISQTDQDGDQLYYDNIISADNTLCGKGEIVRVVNILGQEVDTDQTGLVLIYYSSGAVEKIMR